VGLLGRSGAGKTTLATILGGLLEPTTGTVEWSDDPAPGRERRVRAALAFQEPERGFFEESLLEDVAFGPRNLGLPEEAARRRAEDALRRVGLDPARFGPRDPLTLSGGEARRAGIAGILAMDSRLVVLDEPTTGLDADGWARLREILAGLRADRVAALLVSHELPLLLGACDRLAVLEGGRISWTGAPADLPDDVPAGWRGDGGGDLAPVVRGLRAEGRLSGAVPATADAVLAALGLQSP
jgi:energy-coupling factor transport system ATP-binding protein